MTSKEPQQEPFEIIMRQLDDGFNNLCLEIYGVPISELNSDQVKEALIIFKEQAEGKL
jgi:hypothetical protein